MVKQHTGPLCKPVFFSSSPPFQTDITSHIPYSRIQFQEKRYSIKCVFENFGIYPFSIIIIIIIRDTRSCISSLSRYREWYFYGGFRYRIERLRNIACHAGDSRRERNSSPRRNFFGTPNREWRSHVFTASRETRTPGSVVVYLCVRLFHAIGTDVCTYTGCAGPTGCPFDDRVW